MSRSRGARRGTPLGKLLRLRALGTAGVVAVAAFYVAWPLYAGYEIKSSLDDKDAARLSDRIDFARVRLSLTPAVSKKVETLVADQLRKAGPAGRLVPDELKDAAVPRIVEAVLAVLVTPETLIGIHASGKSFAEALDGFVIERALQPDGLGSLLVVSADQDRPEGSKSRLEEVAESLGLDASKVLGGLGGAGAAADRVTTGTTAPARSAGPPPSYGFDNIKHVSLTGPLGLSVGVSRDPKGTRPELTAEMGFVNGSWMLTGLVPGP